MTWYVEQLLRDGSVLSRLKLDPSTTQIRFGRALDNDVVLDDPHCAAYHAKLEVHADGRAQLQDLNTQNGILDHRNKRYPSFDVTDDKPFRLGQSSIRVRSDAWALAPEQALSRRSVLPYVLLAVLAVFAHGAWDLWLGDVRTQSPPYLNDLGSMALGLGLWSGMYALFGRLITGTERFFSHLLQLLLRKFAHLTLLFFQAAASLRQFPRDRTSGRGRGSGGALKRNARHRYTFLDFLTLLHQQLGDAP